MKTYGRPPYILLPVPINYTSLESWVITILSGKEDVPPMKEAVITPQEYAELQKSRYWNERAHNLSTEYRYSWKTDFSITLPRPPGPVAFGPITYSRIGKLFGVDLLLLEEK